MWCPPAAATTSASTASSLPTTSPRQGSAGSVPPIARVDPLPVGVDGRASASSGSGSSSAPWRIAATLNPATEMTRM